MTYDELANALLDVRTEQNCTKCGCKLNVEELRIRVRDINSKMIRIEFDHIKENCGGSGSIICKIVAEKQDAFDIGVGLFA